MIPRGLAMRVAALSIFTALAACSTPKDESGSDMPIESGTEDLTDMKVGTVLAATTDVRLRSKPSTSSSTLDVVTEGERVTVLDGVAQNGFVKVTFDNQEGWTFRQYYNVVSTPADPPPDTGDDTTGDDTGDDTTGDPTSTEVTAADLRAITSSCDVVSKGKYATDEGNSAKLSVCGLPGAVFWKADLDVDCDGVSSSVCNHSVDGSFQSQTAGTTSTGGPLNAAKVPYIVVPGVSSKFNYKTAGLKMGSTVAVVYKDKVVYGIIGDVGPTSILGEASYAMAKALGMNPSPSSGGVDTADVTYIAFTGSSAVVKKTEDPAAAEAVAKAKARALVGK